MYVCMCSMWIGIGIASSRDPNHVSVLNRGYVWKFSFEYDSFFFCYDLNIYKLMLAAILPLIWFDLIWFDSIWFDHHLPGEGSFILLKKDMRLCERGSGRAVLCAWVDDVASWAWTWVRLGVREGRILLLVVYVQGLYGRYVWAVANMGCMDPVVGSSVVALWWRLDALPRDAKRGGQ